MKLRHLAFVTALLSTLTLVSCNKENGVIKKENNTENVQQGTLRSITFNFSLPGGDPITYVQDQPEYAIDNMTLFMFDASGSKVYSTPVNSNELSGAGPNYTYKKKITVSQSGQYQFYFVANETVNSTAINNLSDLQALIASKRMQANLSCRSILNNDHIPMTGFTQPATVSTTAPVQVAMTRIVARIDIQNNVPNFTIQKVTLSNTREQSYLLLKGTVNNPASPSSNLINGVLPFSAIPSPFTEGEVQKKAFYLYESDQSGVGDKDDVTKVQIIGVNQQGQTFLYTIPFWQNNRPVNVKRNHLYRISLGDTKTPPEDIQKISFSIADVDWTANNVDKDVFMLDVKKSTGEGAYDAGTRILTVNAPKVNGSQFTIMDRFAASNNATYTASVDANAQSWLQASISGDVLTVTTVDANTSGANREGVISISTSADSSVTCQIKVVQTI